MKRDTRKLKYRLLEYSLPPPRDYATTRRAAADVTAEDATAAAIVGLCCGVLKMLSYDA